MKKLILMALVCSALYSSATGYFGIKPIVNEPNCYGVASGSIQLSIVGGTAPYSYAWSGGLTGTNVVTNVPAGSYSVTVTDANNITASYTVIVTQLYALNPSTSAANAGHGTNTGYINLTVDGGTPGYSYLWSNGSTQQNLTGLASGNYTCTITDAVGCTTTASKTVPMAPASLSHYIAPVNNPRDLSVDGNTDPKSGTSVSSLGLSNHAATTLKAGDVQVYPNPTSNEFTLKTGDVSNAEISLIDMNGNTVSQLKSESTETNINVSNLAKGNYIIEIRTADGNMINKKVAVK